MRPGRFDRQITVNLPDVRGREEILKVHAKKVKLAEGVDLAVIARGTPGYSGAELANLINEAALLAARRGLKGITLSRIGRSARQGALGPRTPQPGDERKGEDRTPPGTKPATRCFLNCFWSTPIRCTRSRSFRADRRSARPCGCREEDKYTNRKKELLAGLAVTMGGRVAEEIVFGDITTGARGDIKTATHIARTMVCEWGMSEKIGMVEYGEHEDYVFLGRDISRGARLQRSDRGRDRPRSAQIAR